jgi:outer membrane protein OmpA-like peptidoglycan-associated protein
MFAVLGAALVMSGCASTGTGISADREKCMMIAGLIGAAGGTTAGNAVGIHNDRDLDDRWGYIGGGAVVGGALGAAAGYYLCGAEPVAAMQNPQARAAANPTSGTAPLSVELRGVGSDADGQVVSYAWDLGDGTTATGANVTHRYGSPGDYTAQLTVTDNDGLTDSATAKIRVKAPAPAPQAKQRIVLRGVNFDLDKAAIRPDAQVILQAAAEVLNESTDARVGVIGHTDSTGAEDYNESLSERRAEAVVDYLVSLGVSASRLSASGAGELEPVADNSTADGRAQNRRVELNVAQ